eukprot:6203756-Pleurochrysis_carterae.AAC.1
MMRRCSHFKSSVTCRHQLRDALGGGVLTAQLFPLRALQGLQRGTLHPTAASTPPFPHARALRLFDTPFQSPPCAPAPYPFPRHLSASQFGRGSFPTDSGNALERRFSPALSSFSASLPLCFLFALALSTTRLHCGFLARSLELSLALPPPHATLQAVAAPVQSRAAASAAAPAPTKRSMTPHLSLAAADRQRADLQRLLMTCTVYRVRGPSPGSCYIASSPKGSQHGMPLIFKCVFLWGGRDTHARRFISSTVLCLTYTSTQARTRTRKHKQDMRLCAPCIRFGMYKEP